jgi:tRNA threonylcarbamoyladenosine biosynthesis protein TsaE
MRLTSRGPAETGAIGRRLGSRLRPGDVVALIGDLGAGKTTMVKGIASAFGIPERDVTSASFTVIAEYPGTPVFHHVDLYRINGDEELAGTGFWDCLDAGGVTVIEWAEKIGHALKGAITVKLNYAGDERREIDIEGLDEEYRDYLQTGKA